MVSVHSTGYLRKEKKEKEIEKERKGEDWSAWPALIFRESKRILAQKRHLIRDKNLLKTFVDDWN